MRIGFAGTPAFAAAVLGSLQDAGFAVALVLTQPDRPRGRGLNVVPSPVKRVALDGGIPVYEPATLARVETCAPILANPLDVLVVAAYGLILPPAVLAWPRHGCINVHASLLPRWRGAAPIQRALLAGDAETGVTLMQMDAGLDTGPMLDSVRVPIGPRDTAATLEHKLAAQGAHCLVAHLRRLAAGTAGPPVAQPADGATYAAKIQKPKRPSTGKPPRSTSTARYARSIRRQGPRRCSPAKGSSCGARIRAQFVAPGWRPARVLATEGDTIVVACGDGALGIAELQPAGGRRMSAAAFVAGRRLAPGARFGTDAP